ncbi:MAG: LPXTG cell wall anchor domain-containing protein [Acidimicrobiales bacterium]
MTPVSPNPTPAATATLPFTGSETSGELALAAGLLLAGAGLTGAASRRRRSIAGA